MVPEAEVFLSGETVEGDCPIVGAASELSFCADSVSLAFVAGNERDVQARGICTSTVRSWTIPQTNALTTTEKI